MQETTNIDWKTIIALLAVIISPITSYFIVKKQIAATVLSNERKEWISALRQDVSDFVSILFHMGVAARRLEEEGGEPNYLRFQESHFQITALHIRIEIMLDTSNEAQNALHETIEKALNLVLDSHRNLETKEFKDAANALTPLTQAVIAEQYAKIRRLK